MKGATGGSDASTVAAVTDWLGAHGWWVTGVLALVGARQALSSRRGTPTDEEEAQPTAVDHPGPRGAMMLGNQALQDGDPEIAEAWFATALELDETLAIAALCRGLCHVEMGQAGPARSWLSRALDLEPGDGTARFHLARAQAIDGADREAIRTLAPLVRARPALVDDVRDDPVFADVREHDRWRQLVEAWT